jgi:hypothetical protein
MEGGGAGAPAPAANTGAIDTDSPQNVATNRMQGRKLLLVDMGFPHCSELSFHTMESDAASITAKIGGRRSEN